MGLLGAAYATVRQIGTYPEPLQAYRTLIPKEVAIFKRLGEYLIPPSELFTGHGGDAETLRRLDALLADLPQHKRALVRALPHVFEHGTGLDRFGARCMSKLSDEKCEAYLDDWSTLEDGELLLRQQLWMGLKTLYGMTYWERPEVLAEMGCPVPCNVGANG